MTVSVQICVHIFEFLGAAKCQKNKENRINSFRIYIHACQYSKSYLSCLVQDAHTYRPKACANTITVTRIFFPLANGVYCIAISSKIPLLNENTLWTSSPKWEEYIPLPLALVPFCLRTQYYLLQEVPAFCDFWFQRVIMK